MVRGLVVLAAVLGLVPVAAVAQQVPRRTGAWNPDSLGNHRVVLQVDARAPAVRVHVEWRRRDSHPELKRLIVTDSTGHRVLNATPIRITRVSGDLAFEPIAGPGRYFAYYMPYAGSVRSNYPKITYPAPDTTADAGWLRRLRLDRPADSGWRQLPEASVVAIEAVDSMSRMDPMEVIATPQEASDLGRRHRGEPFVLFPEDRTRAIRMTHDLPQRWIAPGGDGPVTGTALRGEFYAFQLGVWALRALDSVRITFGPLAGPGGTTIPAAAFSGFTTGGVDWQGRPFTRRVQVDSGDVHALWNGVMIPVDAPPGTWRGTLSVTAAGTGPVTIPLRLEVAADTIAHHGDDQPWRLSRLRWLDSRLDLDSTLVPPYTPVERHGETLAVLGRQVRLAATGFPAQVTSYFSREMTSLDSTPMPMLAGPVSFEVEDATGGTSTLSGSGVAFTRELPGAVVWTSTSSAGGARFATEGALEFDGNIEYTVAVTADQPIQVRDIRLQIPLRREVARYLMGMNYKGGPAPDSYDWAWDVKRNQDAAWVGDVNAGVQFTLRDDHYIRPLNTNFYQLRPLVMPTSWENGGNGGCRFRTEGEIYRVTCFSGARRLVPGDTLYYNLRLLLTPFHTIDTRTHFATRYFHRYAPIDSIRSTGANIVNVHHATPVNPWINYPFLRPGAMKAYADSAHAAGMRMKIYYTVRELTNRAPEFWALRSLGDEVLASGPGGGHSWLQEHVGDDYITGWVVPELRDIALVTSGISRWHNFYVEGLQWLVDNVGIDGLYLDDVAFDRVSMQRIRRVLAPGAPGERIDLHSANQYNPNDGFASSANLYLEHFPYIDRLWFGEYFDYDSPPAYWLTEMSGIPFGLMGEMLQDGGNPWRGMVFGMTARLPWAGDPTALWKAWDDFGIVDSRMIGWWADPPVRTGRDDVLATSYVRDGRTMVALASWAPDTARVRLVIDWERLGLDRTRVRVESPAIRDFQQRALLDPDEPVLVTPGKGLLLVIRE